MKLLLVPLAVVALASCRSDASNASDAHGAPDALTAVQSVQEVNNFTEWVFEFMGNFSDDPDRLVYLTRIFRSGV